MDHHTRKLLGFTDKNLSFSENWLTERKEDRLTVHVIRATLSYRPTACRKCGIKNEGQIIKHGTHLTTVQILPIQSQKTILELKRSRFLCKECGATFNAQTPLVREHCFLSTALKHRIALDLGKNISRKDIAERYFVSDVTVLRVLRECMKSFQPNLHYLPEVLCVDEFRSVRSCAGKMSFIFLDGQTKKIIEVLENRRLSFLRDHFLHYSRKVRQRVRYLVMDMNAPYAQLVKGIFPNAQIVIDRFHIVQQINRSFNQLRVQTMNRFKKADPKKYRRLKRFWKLLLKDSDGLDSSNYHYDRSFKQFITEQAIVDELLTYDERLRSAYETCQLLCYHFKQKSSRHFFDLIDSLDPRLPEWFRKKLTFFRRYRSGIENALRVNYSNGPVEGTNNKIKVMKRVAYGYRNFLNFRARIYMIQGLVFQDRSILRAGKIA